MAVLFGASNEELFLVPSRLRFERLDRVWCRYNAALFIGSSLGTESIIIVVCYLKVTG